MKQKTAAFNKAMSFINARINQVCELTKPQKRFLSWIFEKWIMLPVRHNFLNLFRYADGRYSEKSIRNQFSRKMNFPGLFDSAFSGLRQKECIAAFDPSFIRKSGKKTFGKGRFWSGKDQKAKPGLEIGCLALVDVEDETAYSIEAVQTPGEMKNALMDHYVGIIRNNIDRIKSYTDYLAVGRLFYEKYVYRTDVENGLQVITRMRPDASLQYLYKSPQKGSRSRKRRYAGKVDMNNIDKRRWPLFSADGHVLAFELIVWRVTLKKAAKVIYLKHKRGTGYTS